VSDQIKFNFAEIEQLLWDAVIETFQQAMVEILSMLDKYLMATRDKKRRIQLGEKMCLLWHNENISVQKNAAAGARHSAPNKQQG